MVLHRPIECTAVTGEVGVDSAKLHIAMKGAATENKARATRANENKTGEKKTAENKAAHV
jgi:hypothetical protein